ALAIYWSRLGLFNNTTALQAYLGHSVLIGPIIFITIQIIQVVIPVIPGGISTAAGVLVFGPLWGFIYNYVGIAIGSIFNFLLARQFGKPFILHVINEKTYDKYIGTITEKKN
ncbi:VTT domain-containing protein, partial [Acinetobacter baumannii]